MRCAIWPATDADLPDLIAFFRDYAAGLPVDLGPQGFAHELARLPGAYAAPHGALLIARIDARAAGCIALRRLDAGACELKRLYVTPHARRSGLGKALVASMIEEARRLGYCQMKLDTLKHMQAAIALYRSFGFTPVPPYGSHPYPGLVCLGRELSESPAAID